MLDIQFIRDNHDAVKENNKIRKCDVDIDEVLELDAKNREFKTRLDRLRSEVNSISKAGKPSVEGISRSKEIKKEIEAVENEGKAVLEKLNNLLVQLPNITHESVPVGKDETENVLDHACGEKPEFSFKPKEHFELGEKLDLIDTERGAKVSGSRFWYLKNDLVFLEFAIVQYTLNFFAKKKGFTPILPPMIVREKAMYGTGFFPADKFEIYKLENYKEDEEEVNNLYLIGTAEVPLASYHTDELLDLSEGPKKYIGFSSCFRREAGTYGKDIKGILRGHQFDKLEMFIFCKEEESWDMHEYLREISEEFWKALKIPYQVLNMCSGDIGAPNAKKYDIEGWLPGQGKYREIGSCSNDTDFQARRLNIKYQDEKGNKKFVHTLNHTACAIGRTIIAIMENYQQEDGSFAIPEVLREYMGGQEVIK